MNSPSATMTCYYSSSTRTRPDRPRCCAFLACDIAQAGRREWVDLISGLGGHATHFHSHMLVRVEFDFSVPRILHHPCFLCLPWHCRTYFPRLP